jgi:hypothetical protein
MSESAQSACFFNFDRLFCYNAFGKMARTMLRGIRVSSKQELKDRIRLWLDEINHTPVVFRWKYGITEAP